jgi:hypothetical protein
VDVGPSYVVAAAIAVAVVCGPWLARGAALADLAVFVFAGHIFAGFSQLQVPAVGHVTALAVGGVAGAAAMMRWRGQGLAARQYPRPRPVAQQAAQGAPAGVSAHGRPGGG